MVIFKKNFDWFELRADTPVEMRQSLNTRFATYYPILKFSQINMSWTKAYSILILRSKFSYFFIEYLVIRKVSKSRKFVDIFQSFYKLMINFKKGFFSNTDIKNNFFFFFNFYRYECTTIRYRRLTKT